MVIIKDYSTGDVMQACILTLITNLNNNLQLTHPYNLLVLLTSLLQGLTLILLFNIVSKSSGEIFGTWLTRSIRKRPTVLSATTFPD